MKVAVKNSSQKLRFLLVGGTNTLLDFSLLFIVKSLGLPVASANIISTSAAFCFSFFANKKYTFKTKSTNIKREVTLFIVVTLFGLWVLQTIIIGLLLPIFTSLKLSEGAALLFAKLIATIASLTWNYLFYSRLVFVDKGFEK